MEENKSPSGDDNTRRITIGKCQKEVDGKNGRLQHNHYDKFPLRGVGQGSSIAIEEIELGEFDLVVKPKEKMSDRLRKLAKPP